MADAAGVARAVYPSRTDESSPRAVVIVEQGDWRAAISAAQLMARPLRAPILFSNGGELPRGQRGGARGAGADRRERGRRGAGDPDRQRARSRRTGA